MRKNLSVFTLFIVLVISLSVIAGCASEEAAVDDMVLKVGVLGPMTGENAWFGDEIKVAIDMQMSKIDYKVGDYTIELIYIDSESDAEKSAIAYEKAITSDGIDVGFMDWCSWVSVPCMDIAAKYKIPHFFSFGTEQAIDDKIKNDFETYKYWVGKAWPDPGLLTIAYVETIENADWTPRNKNFAVVCGDDSWGRDFGGKIAAQFEKAGWTKVSEDWVGSGETDFAPLIARLKAADVSMVCGTITEPASATSFVKQARDGGLRAVLIADGLGWYGDWESMAGGSSDYILDQIPQWPTAEAQQFVEEFTAIAGFPPSAAAGGMCYDWTGYLIDVFENTLAEYGEINSATLMQYAEEYVITGKVPYTEGIIHKKYAYTPESFPNPVVGKDAYIFPVIQYFDGEGKIVWPDEWAVQDVVIPDFMQ